MKEHCRFEIEVGLLLCPSVRDIVSRMKFEGYEIDSWESSGIFSRTFVFKGDERAIRYLSRLLADWKLRIENTKAK